MLSDLICVLQNVQAFDQRLQYPALPHLLPLLPNTSGPAKANRHSFLSLSLSSKSAKASRQHIARTALHNAARRLTPAVQNMNLDDALYKESAVEATHTGGEERTDVLSDTKLGRRRNVVWSRATQRFRPVFPREWKPSLLRLGAISGILSMFFAIVC